MTISKQAAAKELLRRRHAKSGPVAFAELVDVPGRAIDDDDDLDEVFDGTGKRVAFLDPGTELSPVEVKLALHHKMILTEAEQCFLKDNGRLMIFMPPGSAKSTYGSVVTPSYLMGKYPRTRVGLFSYADTLAAKMGRRTRGIIKQLRYRSMFDTALSPESSAADNFTLLNGSEYMATGILGSATGNRFELVIIDDPVKGREQADSETIRDKTWAAFEDDIKTRLTPTGSMIIIQTRWHEDDLSGRILPTDWNGESGDILCRDGNVWRVLCLQAQCDTDSDPLGREVGEYLWPEWFTQTHWSQFKANSRTWGSLCQQIPKPLDGNLFNPMMIPTVHALPPGRVTWVRGWDLAATEGGGAYTVGGLLGRHESGLIIIGGITRVQYGPSKRDGLIKTTVVSDGRLVKQDFPQDPGAAGLTQIDALLKLLAGYPIVWGPESGDKETRAVPFASQVNGGNVVMMAGDWNRALREEMRGFPASTYKDQVDALSRAYARLLGYAGKMTINKGLLNKARA